ncbi:MAG: hypothetical protein LBM66_05105 [Bifidobacteriaceae bacterium]|jgi:hypothetical protein|nr:hypothetical protein [Bifidobacteriaceae bacterium]
MATVKQTLDLSVDITGWSASSIRRLRDYVQHFTPEAEEHPSPTIQETDTGKTRSRAAGWTRSTVDEAIKRLKAAGGWEQAIAITTALANRGFVTRQEIEKDRAEGRQLRGFTRPVKRIMGQMKDDGLLAANAEALLKAHYVGSSSTADGFELPDEVKKLYGFPTAEQKGVADGTD